MEPTSVAFAVPKENGGSNEAETVEGDILGHHLTEDGPEILTGDLHKPSLHSPEGKRTEEQPLENEEMPDLDDFAHPLVSDEVVEETVVSVVVTETVVVTSVNGSQELKEPLAQDAPCGDNWIVSDENEDSAPNLEFSGDINRISNDVVEMSEVAEVVDDVEAAAVTEQSIRMTDKAEEVQPEEVQPEETEHKESKQLAEKESKQLAETDTDKGKITGKKNEERKQSTSEESTGKDPAKGKFAIQADLNVNSRPKRSMPRRSVFELLQGEIKSSGTSKRSSTDTGSESDPEPGPSRRSVTKKSRLAASEQLESIDEVDRNKGEGNRKCKGNQVKGKSQGKEEKRPSREIRKKSAELSRGMEMLAAEDGDIFVADDFDVVETVVGVDGRNANEAEPVEDEDDTGLTLEEFRAANPIQCFEDDLTEGQNIPCEDPTIEIGADAECELEYNSRWHSYATPRQLESPPPVRKADSAEPPDLMNEAHEPELEEHNDAKATAAEIAGKKRTKYDRVEAPELEAIVDRDKGQSNAPWYMTTTGNDGFLNDTKALQSRIDELIAVNTELKARLKEVENKTATKKFNIDFHSRKFSRAREPVFGSPAERKLVVERKSVGKAAFGSPADKGTVGMSVEKDLKQRELMLAGKEEKLRALDVELDERTSQLKVNEGKLWRTERRLKEMEKTLDYRERVLRRMETNSEKKETDTEAKEASSTAAVDTEPASGPDAPVKEVDVAKMTRKEQELERQRMFLNEEREKLLPKQQRLTKWEAELRKKDDELRSREQELRTVVRSKKGRSSRSEDESDSDDEPIKRMIKKPVGKSQTALVHKRPPISLAKIKKVPPAKVFKTPSKLSSSKSNEALMKHVNRMKAAASRMMAAQSSTVVAGKKRPADAAPVKEYKLRKRC